MDDKTLYKDWQLLKKKLHPYPNVSLSNKEEDAYKRLDTYFKNIERNNNESKHIKH